MSDVRYYWHCLSCGVRLDMHLDHVDPGPRPEYGCSVNCPGTFYHPRREHRTPCRFNGQTIGHASTTFKVVQVSE